MGWVIGKSDQCFTKVVIVFCCNLQCATQQHSAQAFSICSHQFWMKYSENIELCNVSLSLLFGGPRRWPGLQAAGRRDVRVLLGDCTIRLASIWIYNMIIKRGSKSGFENYKNYPKKNTVNWLNGWVGWNGQSMVTY